MFHNNNSRKFFINYIYLNYKWYNRKFFNWPWLCMNPSVIFIIFAYTCNFIVFFIDTSAKHNITCAKYKKKPFYFVYSYYSHFTDIHFYDLYAQHNIIFLTTTTHLYIIFVQRFLLPINNNITCLISIFRFLQNCFLLSKHLLYSI